MFYIVLFMALLSVSMLYIHLAKKYNIVDQPNHRSSHSKVTVRGGGIIFPIAVLLWWFMTDFQHPWMVFGLVAISTISLLDDMFSISRKLRFGIQILALTMSFYDLGVFDQESLWTLPFLYFVALGIINAINFMDGINGITGVYFLVFFGSIMAIHQFLPIFESELIRYILLSILVFLVFNFRKNALMFAGDIGSISIAYLVIYFMGKWYMANPDWTIILFLSVYGMDAFLTLGQRLLKGENVALPHRSHLYQLFVNQLKKQHILISLIYGAAQFLINFVLFIRPQSNPSPLLAAVVLIGMAATYLMIKLPIQKRFKLI